MLRCQKKSCWRFTAARSRFITLRKDTIIQSCAYRAQSRNLPAYPHESIRLYTTDHWPFSRWYRLQRMLQNTQSLRLHTAEVAIHPLMILTSFFRRRRRVDFFEICFSFSRGGRSELHYGIHDIIATACKTYHHLPLYYNLSYSVTP